MRHRQKIQEGEREEGTKKTAALAKQQESTPKGPVHDDPNKARLPAKAWTQRNVVALDKANLHWEVHPPVVVRDGALQLTNGRGWDTDRERRGGGGGGGDCLNKMAVAKRKTMCVFACLVENT